MPLLQDNASFKPVRCFINLNRDEKSNKQNIRITSNNVSILDDEGQIIQEVVPLARILPINLQNQQVSQRTLVSSAEEFLQGFHLTLLFIGSSFSGKERLFDGSKNELPLAFHFIEKLFPMIKNSFRRYQLRMKMVVVIKEKIYDCNTENKYASLKIKENQWEGVDIANVNSVIIQNSQDFKRQLLKCIKLKNKLVLEFKDLYTSYLSLSLIRESDSQEHPGSIVNTLNIFQIPGVELLSDSHNKMKHKEASSSTKSLFSFVSIINELSKNPQSVPLYESSVLGLLLKELLCGNSLLNVYYTLRSQDVEGSLATLKFLKVIDNFQQSPIINESHSFGLLRKLRAEALQNKGTKADLQQMQIQKHTIQNQIVRAQTQDDYNRIVQKYAELKNKYNQSLKAKSQAQLQLIKCEEQKLEIGKSLVEVQIENTKLLQKLQNKDYENGKKILQTENQLAKKENNYQECVDKIQQLSLSLNENLQAKRDLEVQFIALKRNFIMVQKQIAKLKEDNQNLSLDVINITNENQRLKKEFMNGNGSKGLDDNRSRIMMEMQNQKYDQVKRQNKKLEETIHYMKSQVDRYKKELIENAVNFQQKGQKSNASSTYGKDYDRIELENQNMELINRGKLAQRKIQELEEKLGYFEDQNDALENQLKKLRVKESSDAQEYRKKLEEFTKNTSAQAIVRELKQNFAKKDSENLNKINNLKKIQSQKKKEIAFLKSNLRELIALLEEWSPKGAEIPSIKKFKNMNLNEGEDEVSELRIKCMRLEEQLRRLKASSHNSNGLKESRVNQEYNYIKNSQVSNKELDRIREEKNSLAEENRKLTVLLKDGNKMDLNVFRKENQNLKRELDALRNQMDAIKNQSSVSPSTSDQKLQFYEKHLKALEKERSQLLSRSVMAEEQVKNLLAKIGDKKAKY